MAIKTKEELFGDNGVWGARVPISETNPVGTGPGNRAVQFGEPVLASVANRIAYALAINDEDLDARVTPFEESGLDAAYRAGLTNDPEEGRFINLNGGAIETVTDRSGMGADGSGAHFRANGQSDDYPMSTGFETRGHVGASILHVVPYTPSGGHSDLTSNFECSLNMAGIGANMLTVIEPGRSFGTVDGYTDLLPGIDIIFIRIGGTERAWLFGGLVDEWTCFITPLHNVGAPAYGANTACYAGVGRVRHGGFGPAGRSNAVMNSALMVGAPGSPSVLSLLPGGPADSVSALRVFEKTYVGQLRETVALEKSHIRVTRVNAEGTEGYNNFLMTGAPSLLMDSRTRTGQFSFTGDGGIQGGVFGRFRGETPMLTSLMTGEYSTLFNTDAATQEGFSASFLTTSPNIQFAITPTTALGYLLSMLGGHAVLECLTSSNPDYVGHYWLHSTSADDIYALRHLDGSTPVFSAATGTWRIRALFSVEGTVALPMSLVFPDGSTSSVSPTYRYRGGVEGGGFTILSSGSGQYRKVVAFHVDSNRLQHQGGAHFGDDTTIEGDLTVDETGTFGGVVTAPGHVLVDSSNPAVQPTKRIQLHLEFGCPEDNDDLFLADGTSLTTNSATSGSSSMTVTGTVPAWVSPGDRLRISSASDTEHVITSVSGNTFGVRPDLPVTFTSGTELVVKKMMSSKTWRYLDNPPSHSQSYRGWFAYTPRGVLRIPIPVQAQARLTGARVMVWTHARTDDVLAGGVRHLVAGVSRRAAVDFTTPTAPTYSAVGSTTSPADGASGLVTLEITTGTVTMDSAHNYYVYLQAGSDGPGSPDEYDNPSLLINQNTDVLLAVEIDLEIIEAIHTSNQSIYG